MKIKLVKSAGFCMGVRRAMNIVVEEARNSPGPVSTQGPLIHNPQVIDMLRRQGVKIRGNQDHGLGEGTVIIRAHGVTPMEKESLSGCGFDVVDATCPHVIRIQRIIERHLKEPGSVLIVGDHGHAEVNGLLGYAGSSGFVVADASDVEKLPSDLSRVCVVSQTTQSRERFDRILASIQARWPDSLVHNTICSSTHRRQAETVEIARESEVMIIVGGKNSANTVRLASLATEAGAATQHVETSDEINYEALRNVKTIGLTAGASTPNWMIADVIEHINAFFSAESSPPVRFLHKALRFLLDTNIYIGFGAACMVYGCAVMLKESGVSFIEALIAFLYIFAMHTLHNHYERHLERFSNPLRWQFHQRWRKVLVPIGAVSLLVSLGLSTFFGVGGLVLMAMVSFGGVFYRMTIIPKFLSSFFRHRRLRDVPGSKDIFMGLAWGIVLAVLPLLPRSPAKESLLISDGLRPTIAASVTFLFVFIMVFFRSVVIDLRDIQGDKMIGRETIPAIIGGKRTHHLLASLIGLLMLVLLVATSLNILAPVGYLMLIPVASTGAYLYLYSRGTITPYGLLLESLLGGVFILVGLIAAVSKF